MGNGGKGTAANSPMCGSMAGQWPPMCSSNANRVEIQAHSPQSCPPHHAVLGSCDAAVEAAETTVAQYTAARAASFMAWDTFASVNDEQHKSQQQRQQQHTTSQYAAVATNARRGHITSGRSQDELLARHFNLQPPFPQAHKKTARLPTANSEHTAARRTHLGEQHHAGCIRGVEQAADPQHGTGLVVHVQVVAGTLPCPTRTQTHIATDSASRTKGIHI